MSPLTILHWPDNRLRTNCAGVERVDKKVRALAEDMLETMYVAEGRGLAAPQVGVLQRLFVMDEGWKRGAPSPMVCINPEIEPLSDKTALGEEQCLSIPDQPVMVRRHREILLRWTDLDGEELEMELDGAAAVIAQHEADHLDGRLILEKAWHHA